MNSRLQRFYVLDAIRIVFALIMTIDHAGMVPLFGSRVASGGYSESILLTSYVFYLLVERPSHNLARRVPVTSSSRDKRGPAAETVGL
jgi:hypothetical protein